jgi:hypothetical protein
MSEDLLLALRAENIKLKQDNETLWKIIRTQENTIGRLFESSLHASPPANISRTACS